ncbi:hypothetical protein ACIBKX_23480 [Streptomyces sp. NPDC050658]|uniref:hypothetical protein n=1 Tax=unclassified Streptomyces TaxID=2593676 RepID=UPI00343765BE
MLSSPVLSSPVLSSPVLSSPLLSSPLLSSPLLSSPLLSSPLLSRPLLSRQDDDCRPLRREPSVRAGGLEICLPRLRAHGLVISAGPDGV